MGADTALRRMVGVGVLVAALTTWGTVSAQAAPPPVTTFATLQAALGAGGTVQLGADITAGSGLDLTVTAGTPATLDLAGHTLTIPAPEETDAGVSVPAGAGLTITDTGDPSGTGALIATGGTYGAGIGGGDDIAGGSVTVSGGTVTANSDVGAAIGGGDDGTGGPVTVSGGTVTANSDAGAAIGGGANAAGGSLTVSGGTVTAHSSGAAGIGGGYLESRGGDGGPVTVSGGTVTATAGGASAGIGGSNGGDGGLVTVSGGTVTATGADGAAGIGSNGLGAGGGLSIGPAGSVTAINGPGGSAVGGGTDARSSGSLRNAGTLTIPSGAELDIPAGATADNTGTLRLGGTLSGTGTVTNSGTILPDSTTGSVSSDGAGPAGTNLLVTVHNYTVGFDVNGGSGATPASLHPYAATLTGADLSVPNGPTRTGYAFAGWYTSPTSGTHVTGSTDLSALVARGPSTLRLYAHYSVKKYTVTFDPAGGAPTPAVQHVPYGSRAARPASPAETGATFTGWYTSDGHPFDFGTGITGDLTLTAEYARIALTVTDTLGDRVPGGSALDRGQQVTVTAAGLPPDTDYTLNARSAPIALTTLATGPHGTATASVTIPTGLRAGSHHLTVDTAAGTTLASFAFTVPANGPSAASGTPLSRTGADLAPPLGLGALLLIIGIALTLVSRQRRHTRHRR